MIGVTITNQSPDYFALACESSNRFSRFTGLDSHIVTTAGDPFEAKLRLHQQYDGRVVVFHDADLWFIRECDVSKINPKRSEFTARIDPGVKTQGEFWIRDCKTLGISPDLFFNSGFFVANFADKAVRSAFSIALQLYHDKRNGAYDYLDKKSRPPVRRSRINDFGEQSFLNAGIQKAGVEVNDPGPRWNHMHHLYKQGAIDIPPKVIGIHASAVPGFEKMEYLKRLEDALK